MENGDRELPDVLDFFKYARSEKESSKKVTTSVSSKAQPKHNTSDEEGSDQGSNPDSSSRPNRKRKRASMNEAIEGKTSAPALRERHRVTTKGTRVPVPAETFMEMEERYQMPRILRKNLEGRGYEIPTGIQSVGVPIMLEVRPCPSFGQEKRVDRSAFREEIWLQSHLLVPGRPCRTFYLSFHCSERLLQRGTRRIREAFERWCFHPRENWRPRSATRL